MKKGRVSPLTVELHVNLIVKNFPAAARLNLVKKGRTKKLPDLLNMELIFFSDESAPLLGVLKYRFK